MLKKTLVSLLLVWIVSVGTFGQMTRADYQRADSILKLNDLVYQQVNQVNWIDSTSTFWYPVSTREGMVWQLIDAAKKTRKPLFNTQKLLQQLNLQSGDTTTVKKLQLQRLKFDLKSNRIHFEYAKAYWTCALKDYDLKKDSVVKSQQPQPYWNDPFDESGNKPVVSPDSICTAFIKNNNVFIRRETDKKEYQLSFDGSPGDFYSSYMQWSPDSKKLAVNKIRKNENRQIWFVESSPKTQLQPILHKRNYLKPGDAPSDKASITIPGGNEETDPR